MGTIAWAELAPCVAHWFARDEGPVATISALTDADLARWPASARWVAPRLSDTLAPAPASVLGALATALARSFKPPPSAVRGRLLLEVLQEVVHAAASWHRAPPEARRQYDEHFAGWAAACRGNLSADRNAETGALKAWLEQNTPRPPKPGARRREDAVVAIDGMVGLCDWAQANAAIDPLTRVWREATDPFRWYAVWMSDDDWERLRDCATRSALDQATSTAR